MSVRYPVPPSRRASTGLAGTWNTSLTTAIPEQDLVVTARLDNTQTFYGASISVVSPLIQSVRFDNSQTFYGGTVTDGTTVLCPAPLPHLALLDGLGGLLYKLTADVGTYTISGQAAGSAQNRIMEVESGFYVYTGQIGLLNRSVPSSGDAAPLPHLASLFASNVTSWTLVCDPGAYTITGSAGLLDHEQDADQGIYAVTGYDAGLQIGRRLTADSGTYSLTGMDAQSSRGGANLVMTADFGTYSVTGQDAPGQFVMKADFGFYALLGQQTGLIAGTSGAYSVEAEGGTYSLSMFDAGLNFSSPTPDGSQTSGAGDMAFYVEDDDRKPKRKDREEDREDTKEALRKAFAEAEEAAANAPVPLSVQEAEAFVSMMERMMQRMEALNAKVDAQEAQAKRRRAQRQMLLRIGE